MKLRKILGWAVILALAGVAGYDYRHFDPATKETINGFQHIVLAYLVMWACLRLISWVDLRVAKRGLVVSGEYRAMATIFVAAQPDIALVNDPSVTERVNANEHFRVLGTPLTAARPGYEGDRIWVQVEILNPKSDAKLRSGWIVWDPSIVQYQLPNP